MIFGPTPQISLMVSLTCPNPLTVSHCGVCNNTYFEVLLHNGDDYMKVHYYTFPAIKYEITDN